MIYWFPKAVITPYHKMGGIDNRNLFSHNSGGWKTKIKVSTGLVSPGGCEGDCFSLSPGCWRSPAVPGVLSLGTVVTGPNLESAHPPCSKASFRTPGYGEENCSIGLSLVVQWLRHYLPLQEIRVQPLPRDLRELDPSCLTAKKTKRQTEAIGPHQNKQKEKRKCSVYCRHQARNKGSLGSKDSNSLMVCRKAF